MKINSLNKQKHANLVHNWLNKGFKGTFVNRAMQSVHEGLLKITHTVPLTKQSQATTSIII